MMKFAIVFAGLVTAVAAQAVTVYGNVTTDTGNTVFYSTGVYSEIGDRIQLSGTERSGTTASAQYYNFGSAGSFDATLTFYGITGGNPGVGASLGSFTTSGFIDANALVVTSWTLGGFALPEELVFTVTVSNLQGGVDLGLTVFDPPTIGSSSGQFLIVKGNTGFAQASLGGGQDNVYFRLDAVSAVPEFGTAGLMCLGMLSVFGIRSRRVSP